MLDALGNLGDFIGGLAVVVTLAYLAVQVRQNTKALRTASRQEIVSGFRDYNRLMLEPLAAQAFAQGIHDYPDMPFEARNLFGTQINDLMLFFQGANALHESGTLEDETYYAYLDFVAACIATPGDRAWWEEIGPLYTRKTQDAIRDRLARGNLADPRVLNLFRS